MNARHMKVGVLSILAAACPLLAETAKQPAVQRQILNVVLVELDTSPDAKLPKPVVNDWKYWNKSAGKLIARLESDLHYKRGTTKIKEADASLFALRAGGKGLDDTGALRPLFVELERICRVTQRPSFLVMWLPLENTVMAAVHDVGEMTPAMATVMLSSIQRGQPPLDAWPMPYRYVAPPCILWRDVSVAPTSGTLDASLARPSARAKLLQCLRGAQVEVIIGMALKSIRESNPAGTAIKGWMDPTIRHQILNLANNTAPAMVDIVGSALNDGIKIGPVEFGGPTVAQTFRSAFRPDSFGRFAINHLADPQTWNPAGVLLDPDLTVVLDKSGLTSELAAKAVAAVRGKSAGAEFAHAGKKYIAVKTPGTKKLFQVPVGKYHVCYTDVPLVAQRGALLQLTRYYDSASSQASALGNGWSLLPFSLRIGQRNKTESGQAEVAAKPTLIDWQAGAELTYHLMRANSPTTQPAEKNVIARYRKVSSSLQPDLEARRDGGYLASFANRFQIAFDRNGRLQWMGRSEKDRVEYIFKGKRLMEIRGGVGNISMVYDKQGRLSGAKSPARQEVKYVLDSSGRLVSVSGSESGSCVFTYGTDGRLATVNATRDKQKPDLLVANTYDKKGRMLTHRMPRGQWRFSYDDDIGCAIVTDPSGKHTSHYYDACRRLVAYGSSKDQMTLFNYDITGRILQVAVAKMLNDPSKGERPRFKVSEIVAPMPSSEKKKGKKEKKDG